MKHDMDTYELWLMKSYILNFVNFRARSAIDVHHDLFKWLQENQKSLGLLQDCGDLSEYSDYEDEDDFMITPALTGMKRHQKIKRSFEVIWRDWKTAFATHVKASKPQALSRIVVSAQWVSKLCNLSPYETAALILLAMFEKHKIMQELYYAFGNNRHGFISNRVGIDDDDIEFMTGIEANDGKFQDLKIYSFGFVVNNSGYFRLSKNIRKIILNGISDEGDLKSFLFGSARSANLELSDYHYLGHNVGLLKNILINHNEASAHNEIIVRPLNIFLYGAPGTGKTEFAKAIGANVNRQVYFIGEDDGYNHDIGRSERVSSLMLLSGINDFDNPKLLVVDEADEILSDIGAGTDVNDKGSKIFINRLLENIATPIIWIVNDHTNIDNAVLRRMNFSMAFPKPPLEVRKGIISKIAANHASELSHNEVEQLARYETSPAYFENAIALGHKVGGFNAIKQVLENHLSSGEGIRKTIAAKDDFKIELSNANIDLIALKERVKACNSAKLTFCFSGAPGTGKSEYARFLAKEMGYEIIYKRYSDLASKWLGETEQNIANAFAEASQKRAFLILDEADSLLRRRENAQKSWEVTQVNEFLTQIENHDYPFAITTNAFDNLDAAAMRRLFI